MTLPPISLTDTFSQWKDKINALINQMNNVNPGQTVFALEQPINNNDVLVWNSSTQMFTNVSFAVLLQQVPDNTLDDVTEFFNTNQQDIF